MNWIELHTDTNASAQLSFLRGADLIALCAENGCTAVACTDRNSILAYLIMEEEAKRKGIQLIYGVTLDCVDREDRYAVTLLAKNETGRHHIFALINLLERNQFPFGRCVTRQQIEEHRDGLLLGASAVDGQLIRAIQLRRGTRRLKQIAAGYDYLEFPLEPYDTAAQLLQLSREISIPLCAVQSARMAPNPSAAEIHAFQTICYTVGRNDRPTPYIPPQKTVENFFARYVLPSERQAVEQALFQGPAQIIEQIEPLSPLQQLLNQNAEAAEQRRQKQLRSQAETALTHRYGPHPSQALIERFHWELDRIEHLNLAGQILLMQEIVKAVRETGGRASIAGTWNSSFLLYLLGITELNPLPPSLAPEGLDLCPVPLLGSEKALQSAELRLSEGFTSAICKQVVQRFGRRLLQLENVMREIRPKAELHALIEPYLNDCCSKEISEALRADGSFYYLVNHHMGELRCAAQFISLYLLPEAADPSALPLIAPDFADDTWKTASLWPNRLKHIPHVMLLGSAAQSVLMRCVSITGVNLQEIPLNDHTVYAALGEAYLAMNPETPVAAACELLGTAVNQFDAEIFHSMDCSNLYGLIRFISLCHGTGLWEDNQKTFLQSGVICPDQLITCREDVYRYLLAHGVSASEATALMEYVRMGKVARSGFTESQWELLQKCGAEDWFLQTCRKIQYLFPESHSAEYAVSTIRLIWYALYHPETAAIILEEHAAYQL